MTNTTDASERDVLAEIIDRGEHYYDTGSHYELSATDAAHTVLAAGYRKPRTITTAEELDALPFESVIRDADSHLLERWGDGEEVFWATVMVNAFIARGDISLPVDVLWEPTP